MLRSLIVVLASAVSVSAVQAGAVTLQLNETGVAGLEQMLDLARRTAPTMRDADMAVSLYNALQAAKVSSAQSEIEANRQGAEAARRRIEELQAEVDRMKSRPLQDEGGQK